MGNTVKSSLFQIGTLLLIFGALFLTIPAVPSVDAGHGYDSFPNPTLFIGLLCVAIAAGISIRKLGFPKLFWVLFASLYVVFSLGIHARVWWF
jgi:hypothetical protein